jgi:phosphoribosylamine--glycine ligase
MDLDGLVSLALERAVDLVVVGPEAPLCEGLVDRLTAADVEAFGPTRAAARLEGSKVYAKQFMDRHHIPTAAFVVMNDEQAALAHVRGAARPLVIKADGLAAGKGVVVCDDVAQAEGAVHRMLGERSFGQASANVVIEERLRGREASVMALVSGTEVVLLPTAEDHKAAFDGDQGPMTGGMGAVSPSPLFASRGSRLADKAMAILQRAAEGCVADGHPYRGVLYAGLMIDEDEVSVLEFNCRLGDPEAEVVLPRLRGSLAELLTAVAAGSSVPAPRVEEDAAACVVLAAAGYPGTPQTGQAISGIERADAREGCMVFHAGTRHSGDAVVTAGGRVLAVTALGPDPMTARHRAYEAVGDVHFDGAFYRRDIGARAPSPPTEG